MSYMYNRALVFALFSFFFFPCQCVTSFGSTHFIVGADAAEVLRDKRIHNLKKSLHIVDAHAPIAQAFFTPDDDMQHILLDLIACEKKAIYIAAFLITDQAVVQALIDACARGVIVQIVTDRFCCKGRYGKACRLSDSGVEVLVYRGRKSGALTNLMHNKYIVFKENICGRSLVWTGSFNFTNSARLCNQENVILLDNQSIIDRYLQQFDVLKSRSAWFQRGSYAENKKKKVADRKRKKDVVKTANSEGAA